MASTNDVVEPVAICGMAMRMPAGICTDDELWDTLINGKDMRSPIPAERWNAPAFGEALGKKGAIKTQHGYFLNDDLSVLEASFFTLTKSELERTDPQQRKILEITRECLESAGEVGWRGKQIGCFVGTFGEDWLHQQSADKTQFTGAFSGSGDLMIANRVSYEFDFRGPSEVTKTGCSASLVSLHNAVRSIQNGDCESAIVAGTSLIMGPYLMAAMTHQGVLSPEGSCKTFDVSADGFARADAINAVFLKPLSAAQRPKETPQLIVLSANTQPSLNEHSKRIVDYLTKHPESATDVAYTLARRREHLPQRTYFITSGSLSDPTPIVKAPFDPLPITMIFSGQGAQWPGMGRKLIEMDPDFEKDIGAMDALLQSLAHPSTWKLHEELAKPAETSQINKAEFAQPLCTAVQIGLVNAFARHGIAPTAVVGHSSGEIAAAYAAGSLTMPEAMVCAYYRGYVSAQQDLKGGMAAIGMGAEEVAPFLKPGVVVACENSPSSTTISGDVEPLWEPEVLARELKVDMAYHSHHMQTLSEMYVQLVKAELASQGLKRADAKIPIFSSVTTEVITSSSALGPDYWASNLTSPVRFGPAVIALLEHQRNNLFLEHYGTGIPNLAMQKN